MKDRILREQIVVFLTGGEAHGSLEEAVRQFPSSLAGEHVDGHPHTAWRLLEHMRIAQWDILEFSRNPKHVSPDFPDGYWPAGDRPPTDSAWKESVESFCADLKAMQGLVMDPAFDLFAPLARGDGQTLLREALLVADHNSYHLGQLVSIRRGGSGSMK